MLQALAHTAQQLRYRRTVERRFALKCSVQSELRKGEHALVIAMAIAATHTFHLWQVQSPHPSATHPLQHPPRPWAAHDPARCYQIAVSFDGLEGVAVPAAARRRRTRGNRRRIQLDGDVGNKKKGV